MVRISCKYVPRFISRSDTQRCLLQSMTGGYLREYGCSVYICDMALIIIVSS